MECKFCKSNWDTSLEVEKCPFCGKDILNNSEEITNLTEGITHIISEFGSDILIDSKRLMSLIMDFVPGCEKDKKLFKIAATNGASKTVFEMLNNPEPTQRELLAKKAIQSLEDDVFLSEENAYYIFNILLEGASLPTISLKTKEPSSAESEIYVASSSPIATIKEITAPVCMFDEKLKQFNALRKKVSITDHAVMLCKNGMVNAIGANQYGQCNTNHWENIKAVCCTVSHTYGLSLDGRVFAAGANNYGQCNVETWSNIKAIDASMNHVIGLKNDGTVVAAGDNQYGQCNVTGWNNIEKIYCSLRQTFGIKKDGTVICAGDNREGQCNVYSWKDIVKIVANPHNTFGLKKDGTVLATGDNKMGQCNVANWKNIVDIDAGTHIVALSVDGHVFAAGDNSFNQCDVSGWNNIIGIVARTYGTIAVTNSGKVFAVGSRDNGQLDVSGFDDIISCVAITKNTLLVRKDGTVVVLGSNQQGQCDVNGWNIYSTVIGNSDTIQNDKIQPQNDNTEKQERATHNSVNYKVPRNIEQKLLSEKQSWIDNGKCSYCGGVFKGIFKKVCVSCGREKSY